MESNSEILESLLEISSYKRMIRVMAWVLRAATIFKGYSFSSEALVAKELARGKPLSKPSCNVSIFQKKFGMYTPGLKGLAVKLQHSCLNCQHHDSRSKVTPEPPMPVDRVVLTALFSTVGVDIIYLNNSKMFIALSRHLSG